MPSKTDLKKPARILITGASSGLGTALALEYAAPDVTLYLGGRHRLRLERVAQACREKGAIVRPHTVDVSNEIAMKEWLLPLIAHHPLDLVIANAGISAGTADGDEPTEQITEVIQTNVLGVIYTVQPLLPSFRQAKSGKIALISSLAGFRGLPGSPAYCASKAAVRVYGEALRGLLREDTIGVSVVCPGYVKTPMTDTNDFRMPLMLDSNKAAKIIKKGIAANKPRIAFPFMLYSIVWLLMVLPNFLTEKLLAGLPRKR